MLLMTRLLVWYFRVPLSNVCVAMCISRHDMVFSLSLSTAGWNYKMLCIISTVCLAQFPTCLAIHILTYCKTMIRSLLTLLEELMIRTNSYVRGTKEKNINILYPLRIKRLKQNQYLHLQGSNPHSLPLRKQNFLGQLALYSRLRKKQAVSHSAKLTFWS